MGVHFARWQAFDGARQRPDFLGARPQTLQANVFTLIHRERARRLAVCTCQHDAARIAPHVAAPGYAVVAT